MCCILLLKAPYQIYVFNNSQNIHSLQTENIEPGYL